jgi:hypothetical protein
MKKYVIAFLSILIIAALAQEYPYIPGAKIPIGAARQKPV